ncbi:DUF1799 domain-containing protein [Paracidovorax wautersii]|uniref:Uncharacterized protein n=1 Tax=Paracidovorax wautersii TaxID=1177982 RepID=A0A1I2E8G5_9BURK|nr:DUF1799 domain-containing protein [Paracidovorax wautersii]SFE88781.1 Phage related hypothetical protein [Paracidovorax wautersii]
MRGEAKKLRQAVRKFIELSHAEAQTQPSSAEPASPLAGLLLRVRDLCEEAGPADSEVHLWPDNVDAWEHWLQVQTQWRVGFDGRHGLDYAGVRAYLDELGPPAGPERASLFQSIRACECEALEAWACIRDKEQRRCEG